MLALTSSALVLAFSPQFWGISELEPGSGEWVARDCFFNEKNSRNVSLDNDDCRFGDLDGAPIYLIGDSNAAHHSDGLYQASRGLNRPMTVLYAGSCPTLRVKMASLPGLHSMDERDADRRCQPWHTFITEELRDAPRGTVVFSISPRYWDPRYVQISSDDDGTQLDQGDILRRALSELVSTLDGFGHDVVLVSPMIWPQLSCPETIANLAFRTTCESSLDIAEEWNLRAIEDFTKVHELSGASLVDLTKIQCPQGSCPKTIGSVEVYSLGFSHLSQEFGNLTSSDFSRVLSMSENSVR